MQNFILTAPKEFFREMCTQVKTLMNLPLYTKAKIPLQLQ